MEEDKLQCCWEHECENYGICSLYIDGDITLIPKNVPKCLYFWMKLYNMRVADDAGVSLSEEQVWTTAAHKEVKRG